MAAVVWLTGRPASGKTTLANAVLERLRGAGTAALVLDSDEVRAAIEPAHGYDPAGRDAFYATLANLAATFESQSLVVLVAATANLARYRDRARERSRRFIEVYLDTPPEVCAERDPKGLYARAEGQEGNQLPGVGAAYQVPERPDVVVGPDDDGVERVVDALTRDR